MLMAYTCKIYPPIFLWQIHLRILIYGLPSQATRISAPGGVFFPNFAIGETVYLGFRLDHDKDSATEPFYGWVSMTPNNSGLWTIHEWAYEDVLGEAIAVGQRLTITMPPIPEPTSASLGLLALGAAGLRRWRKGTA